MIALHQTLPFATTDGQALSARRLVRADAPALQTFHAALDPESRRKFTPHRYDDDALQAILARSENGDDFTLGAFDGPVLAAYFFLWHFSRPVPLLGIGMRPEYQHRGLGKPLLSTLIEAARESGRAGVELTTMLDNHNAYALYEKCGFRYHGNVENVTGDGAVVIERAMFLALQPGAQPPRGRHQPPVL